MLGAASREAAWQRVAREEWDLIVVGGGVTGAGILREAARVGLRALLFEQNDFAYGTSSRSSKLVHGGLRYLSQYQFSLTRQSVAEREILLREGPGLIERLPFLFTTYEDDRMPSWMTEVGLTVYDWLAHHWRAHQHVDAETLQMMVPGIASAGLTGGFCFYDAQTDDARLVLRLIREGTDGGKAVALNYARVEGLLRGGEGLVNGVVVRDQVGGAAHPASARAVINATGVWVDHLRRELGHAPRMRPLRGSHLIFSQRRFPIFQAITFPHPDDGRPVFIFPWEGVTLVGTTDLDHHENLDLEPAISPEEVGYLLRAVQVHFPLLALTQADVVSTFAGVRPVVDGGREVAPSKASREHVIWEEDGMLTVAGGKLTAFRRIALDLLHHLRDRLPSMPTLHDEMPALDPLPPIEPLPPDVTPEQARRLVAYHGAGILEWLAAAPVEERRPIQEGLPFLGGELRWAAQYEAAVHLEDLLLRRVRIGLLLPEGGAHLLPRLRGLVQNALAWDDNRWLEEETRYRELWKAHYSLPDEVYA
jgi:glycerol-3-phosphate dehydrogenase